jgi:hypothetical protein|tara:strand:- start:2 stop:301 length:300 start_codon:yes stop_codon:yes gene_type:complete
MKTILLSILIAGCAQQADALSDPVAESYKRIDSPEENLDESAESLDRTLVMMDQMIVNLDRMNKNMDAIFRAITDCKSEEECQYLKDEYIRQYEENKHQ